MQPIDNVSDVNQDHLLAIGKMTAQLAHQIRTPLSSAMLYTEHLAMQNNDPRSKQWIHNIQECYASIEQQIHDLLLFARGEIIQPTFINLQEWGSTLEQRAQRLVENRPVNLRVSNQLSANNYYLHSESLLGAVLNLISNSIQAGANDISLTLNNSELKFSIQVNDNGCGMSNEVKAHAFAPFFTTKARGTGLGLAVVEAVINAHHGTISLDSLPEQGCCVTLNLPG